MDGASYEACQQVMGDGIMALSAPWLMRSWCGVLCGRAVQESVSCTPKGSDGNMRHGSHHVGLKWAGVVRGHRSDLQWNTRRSARPPTSGPDGTARRAGAFPARPRWSCGGSRVKARPLPRSLQSRSGIRARQRGGRALRTSCC